MVSLGILSNPQKLCYNIPNFHCIHVPKDHKTTKNSGLPVLYLNNLHFSSLTLDGIYVPIWRVMAPTHPASEGGSHSGTS